MGAVRNSGNGDIVDGRLCNFLAVDLNAAAVYPVKAGKGIEKCAFTAA